jgi:hypothetical protein
VEIYIVFCQPSELVFKGISTDGRDYHTEMNSKIFKKWVNEQLESALPEKSLIFLHVHMHVATWHCQSGQNPF